MATPETYLKIPTERVGALIGSEGRIKKSIEEKLGVILEVESQTGGITIALSDQSKDPSVLFKAKDVVTAIGRGFSPERAFRLLLDEENMLEIIDLQAIFGKSESDLKRVKGRIIGMNGKTRQILEELTECDIAVYGRTVGMIGPFENLQVAREAVQMLIRGSMHNVVYRFLHRKRREFKKKKLELWEKPPETKEKGSATGDSRAGSKNKKSRRRA
ncbi:MAG: KH domain-containing protein [Candidatus Bathyarchaeota archaeon]|nr:KH domain-containing protein [Candidatus Bathyarchaeota archaeon]